jgi:hypothetical protein
VTSDFALEGIMTPGRVCAIVTPALLRDLRAAARGGQLVDPQVGAWIKAVVDEGERWAACGDARKSTAAPDDPSHSGHDLLAVVDVADEIGCTQSNVRRLIAAGKLSPIRSKPYIFDRAEVERFTRTR